MHMAEKLLGNIYAKERLAKKLGLHSHDLMTVCDDTRFMIKLPFITHSIYNSAFSLLVSCFKYDLCTFFHTDDIQEKII